MEKNEIFTTTVINGKEQRKQSPGFGVEILPIRNCALGLGSLRPQAGKTILHLPSVKFESQVVIRKNH